MCTVLERSYRKQAISFPAPLFHLALAQCILTERSLWTEIRKRYASQRNSGPANTQKNPEVLNGWSNLPIYLLHFNPVSRRLRRKPGNSTSNQMSRFQKPLIFLGQLHGLFRDERYSEVQLWNATHTGTPKWQCCKLDLEIELVNFPT